MYLEDERLSFPGPANVVESNGFEIDDTRATETVEAPVDVVPGSLVLSYAELAADHARYEQLEDGSWFADVVGLDGAWAEGDTPTDARSELVRVIEGWVRVKLRHGDDDIPPIEGIDLRGARRRAAAEIDFTTSPDQATS